MKKSIACEGCGKEYSLDLEKYGGKKVRCKQCNGVIVVPLDDDEFEVVEEADATASPSSTLQPRRTLDALDSEQLQRTEQSRSEIRKSFLESQGAWKTASERRSATLRGELDELTAESGKAKSLLGKLKSAHATSQTTGVLGQPLTQMHKAQKEVEAAYSDAVQLLGSPVGEVPDFDTTSVKGYFKSIGSVFTGQIQKGQQQVKKDTIAAAIKHLETQLSNYDQQKLEKQQAIAQAKNDEANQFINQLNDARKQIAAGNLGEAQSMLEMMLRESPPECLGPVFVMLSQCSFVDGNAHATADNIQKAICFGAMPPPGMADEYVDLWAKAESALPDVDVSPTQQKLSEGLSLLDSEQYQQAVDAFSTAIDQDGSQAEAFVGRGKAFMELAQQENDASKVDLAAADFKRANSLNPQLSLPDVAQAKNESGIDWAKVGSAAVKVGAVTAGVLGVLAIGVLGAVGQSVSQSAGMGSSGSSQGSGGGGRAPRWDSCSSCGGKGFQNIGTPNERRCPSCGGARGKWRQNAFVTSSY